MAMLTLNGAWCASNVSLGAFPGKLNVKDRSGLNKKNFFIWFELNPIKVLDLFLGLLNSDLMFCQLIHIFTSFCVKNRSRRNH